MDTRNVQVVFADDNRSTILNGINTLQQKFTTLNKTVVPLMEAAMLTLLQQNTQYKRVKLETSINMNGQAAALSFVAVYQSSVYVGTDIQPAWLQADQNAIREKVALACKVDLVSIDTNEGTITIKGSL